MCMDCFNTIGAIQRQKLDKHKTCSTCGNHEATEDFSDCLCVCVLDGLEKGKNSTCKNWKL